MTNRYGTFSYVKMMHISFRLEDGHFLCAHAQHVLSHFAEPIAHDLQQPDDYVPGPAK